MVTKPGMHVRLASGLEVRLAPDAWASRTLLLHIDRRHRHWSQSWGDHLLGDLQIRRPQSKHPSAFCHPSLLHTPPHFPSST